MVLERQEHCYLNLTVMSAAWLSIALAAIDQLGRPAASVLLAERDLEIVRGVGGIRAVL